jgi:hypothetical protein
MLYDPRWDRPPGMYHDADGLVCVPQTYGPTWTRNPDWDGADPLDQYILPERTLGWQALRWVRENLLSDDLDENDEPLPFKPTFEQSRFILWFYAIDEHGNFIYREFVLQRLKGWGKDPLAAVISAIEFVGPCRFAGWANKDLEHLGLKKGDPVGKGHPRAWVQVAAVSLEQTGNTMKLFQGLFTQRCIQKHSIDIGKERVYAYHGQRVINAVTSSPKSLEGNRATLVIMNETHHWQANNSGHDMADVIERNVTKSKDGAARTLAITNAYEPSEDSVAQRMREAWEEEQGDETMIDSGMCYDSLEAPPDAKLRPPTKELPDGTKVEPTREEIMDNFRAILEAVRGDSIWLNVVNMTKSILNRRNKPSRSRRFWFNQVVAAEDAWIDPGALLKAVDPYIAELRKDPGHDVLKVGWDAILPGEEVVLFGDGSKSHDATAIMGCRVSDGYVFTVGIWEKPKGKRGEKWLAPRGSVTARVNEIFKRMKVVAFWFDPSHTQDDEDGGRYWDGTIDSWFRDHREELDQQYWPLKSGNNTHGVLFDMATPANRKLFVGAAEQFVDELETLNDIEEFEPQFSHDGHPLWMSHARNAKRFPTDDGISLMKEGRESLKKIDAAVCAVGARMLRRVVLNRPLDEEEPPGDVWGFRRA